MDSSLPSCLEIMVVEVELQIESNIINFDNSIPPPKFAKYETPLLSTLPLKKRACGSYKTCTNSTIQTLRRETKSNPAW